MEHHQQTDARPPHAVFMDWLGKNKLKLTPQRNLILELFLEAADHVTPESMHERARQRDGAIGVATVYRTLKLLAQSGVAREILFDDGVTHYELLHGTEHHDHIICTRCGKRAEVVDPAIERLQEELAAEHGFELKDHKMFLYGLCRQCREKIGGQRQPHGKK